ncbi:GtrA family protein [Methylocystis sp. IM3]|uniref:GtrA family protein n=1 Tax=unclassified Methylocystis TaxID=2625913 RepID=UPI0030F7659A
MRKKASTLERWGAHVWRLPFARFLLVGSGNTIFGYSVFYMLLYIGCAPTAALAIATVIGVVFNFFTTGRIVFKSAEAARLWRFGAVYGAVFVANAGLLEAASSLGLAAAPAQALLTPPCVLLSYALNRALVFPDREGVRQT